MTILDLRTPMIFDGARPSQIGGALATFVAPGVAFASAPGPGRQGDQPSYGVGSSTRAWASMREAAPIESSSTLGLMPPEGLLIHEPTFL